MDDRPTTPTPPGDNVLSFVRRSAPITHPPPPREPPEHVWAPRYDPTTIECTLRSLQAESTWQGLPLSAQAYLIAFVCDIADLSPDEKCARRDMWAAAMPRYAREGDHNCE